MRYVFFTMTKHTLSLNYSDIKCILKDLLYYKSIFDQKNLKCNILLRIDFEKKPEKEKKTYAHLCQMSIFFFLVESVFCSTYIIRRVCHNM